VLSERFSASSRPSSATISRLEAVATPCRAEMVPTSIRGMASAIRTGRFHPSFNRAELTPWSTAAVDGPFLAAMEQTSIFAMGFVIRRAQCQGAGRKGATITSVETAITCASKLGRGLRGFIKSGGCLTWQLTSSADFRGALF
jgi:hypothetical protein